jgi:hypothetical protein
MQKKGSNISSYKRRYSPEPGIRLIESFLGGSSGWREFSDAAMELWQWVAREEYKEQEVRPRLTPGALQKMGLDADADPDPLTPRQRAVRDALGELDEDVRWYLGDAEQEEKIDDAFMETELRKVAAHTLEKLRALRGE